MPISSAIQRAVISTGNAAQQRRQRAAQPNGYCLIAHCRAHLSHFKCPTTVEFSGGFARTSTGKLQKFKIRAPYWEGRESMVSGA